MPSLSPYTDMLGTKLAKHLLNRATFGPSKQQIETFANYTPEQALEILLTLPETAPEPPLDPVTGQTWLPIPNTEDTDIGVFINNFIAWDMEQKRKETASLSERMTWFWHTHLPIASDIVRSPSSMYYQNVLYRYYALGNYKTLSAKTIADNGMLRYIDNYTNDYASINENYARELLELYTVGRGEQTGPDDYTNYNETDIQEVARIISGLSLDTSYTNLDPETEIPRGKVVLNASLGASKHDPGTKTLGAAFQNQTVTPNELVNGFATEQAVWDEINQLMDIVFEQTETAKFICRKLYRYFVYWEITPQVETDIITPLAQTLIDNEYEIIPVLKQIFKSEHFYDLDNNLTEDNNVAALIKSPLDVIMGAYRFWDIQFPDLNDTTKLNDFYSVIYRNIIRKLKDQGLTVYNPYDVAGYDPYFQFPAYNRLWITPTNLAYRYNFSDMLLSGIENDSGEFLAKLDIIEYVNKAQNVSDPTDPAILVTELTNYLLAADLTDERRSYFTEEVLKDGLSSATWADEWQAYKTSSDDTGVRTQLEKLVTAIMQSPEYQLC